MWHITITKGTNKGKIKEKRKREKVKRLYKHLLFFGDFLEVGENNIK
jgi:DNA-directed RNA polymerase delta subunit